MFFFVEQCVRVVLILPNLYTASKKMDTEDVDAPWRLLALYACGAAGIWLLLRQRPPQRARQEEAGEVQSRHCTEWDVVHWEDASAEHAEQAQVHGQQPAHRSE